MKRILLNAAILLGLFIQKGLAEDPVETPFVFSGNPLVREIYTADPSAHVWEDGRLYVYPSQDISPPQGCDMMDKYHVFSTDDMVNWIDHGQILEAKDVWWSETLYDDAGKVVTFMWAPDCVYKDGIYYYYFPHPNKNPWNTNWKIGLATSQFPAKDFVVQDYIKTKDNEGNEGELQSHIDPCIFIDEDGKAYLIHGGGGQCWMGELEDNMQYVKKETYQLVSSNNATERAKYGHTEEILKYFHEGPWLYKRNGIYYLTYPGNSSSLPEYKNGQDQLLYAMSDSPWGPWIYKGSYLGPTGCDTSHGSVVEYKGQSYAFYHNMAISGRGNLRSICFDKLYYNEDGTIQRVKQTKDVGTPREETPYPVPGIIEAKNFNRGKQNFAFYAYSGSVSIGVYRGTEYVQNTSTGDYINYTFEVTKTGNYDIEIIGASTNQEKLGGFHLDFDFEKKLNPYQIDLPYGSRSAFQTTTLKNIYLTEGTHIMTFNIYGQILVYQFVFSLPGSGVKEMEQLMPPVVLDGSSNGIYTITASQQGHISLININGQVVYSSSIAGGTTIMDISDNPAGLYIFTFHSDNQIYKTKLVKK